MKYDISELTFESVEGTWKVNHPSIEGHALGATPGKAFRSFGKQLDKISASGFKDNFGPADEGGEDVGEFLEVPEEMRGDSDE